MASSPIASSSRYTQKARLRTCAKRKDRPKPDASSAAARSAASVRAMSTAEAVSVAVTAGLRAAWFSGGAPAGADLVEALVGTALKDEAEDLSRLRSYFSRVVQPRSSGRGGARWRELYAARHRILD